jgi:hypothetical protein
MDNQLTYQVTVRRAPDASQSFHFTFPQHSALAQIVLGRLNPYVSTDPRVAELPLAVYASFYRAKTSSGEVLDFELANAFGANGLSEVEGAVTVQGGSAAAVVNIFFWPSVL